MYADGGSDPIRTEGDGWGSGGSEVGCMGEVGG